MMKRTGRSTNPNLSKTNGAISTAHKNAEEFTGTFKSNIDVRDGKSEDSKIVWEWDDSFALNKPLTEIL